MATFTEVLHEANGNISREWIVTFTPATVYATGGYAGLKSVIGATEIFAVVGNPLNVASQDYGVVWDEANGKLLVATEGAQVADTTDITAIVSMTLLVKGT